MENIQSELQEIFNGMGEAQLKDLLFSLDKDGNGSCDIEEFEALQMALLASEAEVHKRSTSAIDVSDGKRHKGDVDALPFIDETPSFAEMFM